jgi:heme A synthase
VGLTASRKGRSMLTIGMVVLGLVTFLAMLGFVTLCDHV